MVVEEVDEVDGGRPDLGRADADSELPDAVKTLPDLGKERAVPEGPLVGRKEWPDGVG